MNGFLRKQAPNKVLRKQAGIMTVPAKILNLVKRFEQNLDAYKQGRYNEAQVRREFIDPFFKTLGWDVDNEQGYAESYKDVVHEDAIKVSGALKAPDYCFRIGGTRKFFLEAKKPSINIKDAIPPAYQLRRYAWSAKLPLSILTDFEELAVYDCRVKPIKTDRASKARILYFNYMDYPERWDEIAAIFSREAVLKGSFDKYAESKKVKRGTAEVDAAFLQEIERWRQLLARNIALRNSQLSQRELNFAVQRTIDRIIFLRICEDRGIEIYGKLMALQNGHRIYQRLLHLFRQADDRYNSGLFFFKLEKGRPDNPDTLTPGLTIDDKILKDILKSLYYPDSPYEFSVLPADILGQVYEQFLGKVIRLTPAHRAIVEDKPEVKKAGGVYYTPTYIVDYIVKHTVGKLVVGKKPGPRGAVTKLKILDPACGSGSFLLGAYQFLLDWHRDEYIRDDPRKWATGRTPRLYQSPGGDWRLTTDERKRILLNNIYGVDIDPQAVETTKLSLLLKVLEGEDEQTLGRQLSMFQERVLPDLANNIKCGNSLIGPDFYKAQQMSLIDEEEIYRINAFDWEAEFPEVMSTGGFDAVIGNPPYGYLFTNKETLHLCKRYSVFASISDAYVGFIQKAHELIRKDGRFGFIVPSAWLGGPAYKELRSYLLEFSIDTVILLPYDIFKDAYIDTVLITTRKESPKASQTVVAYEYPKREKISSIDIATLSVCGIDQQAWHTSADCKFVLDVGMLKILSELRSKGLVRFAENVSMKRGVLFTRELLTESKTAASFHPYFEGDVYRYVLNYVVPCWVEYGPKMREYPKEFHWFEGERVLLRRLVNRKHRLMATRIENTVITNKNLYVIKPTGKETVAYILGIINSRLISRVYLAQVSQATKDDFPQVTIRDILSLPFRPIDFSDLTENARHGQMVELVEQMLQLNKQLAEAKVPQIKTVLQRQIEATDRRIDQLVYELYGLTKEEIKIVEESRK